LAIGTQAGLSPFARGADKSGVGPQVISLPKGPGSIEGLGEAFQPSLNSGTAKHSIAIKLPPATAGHAPALGLIYEGGDGNSCLGMGWQLPLPYVQLQTDKSTPRYDGTDRLINDAREELVPVVHGANTDFFCENEASFMRYRRVGEHWEAHRPDGTRLIFGETASARVKDSSTPAKVFRWHLESVIDTKGNTILYRYASFPGPENLNQVYCASVEYGAGASPHPKFHFIVFDYESRSDWFEDCRSGFSVRTGRRLKNVIVGTQGVPLPTHAQGDFNGDTVSDALNRRYEVAYLPNAPVSLVASVTVFGSDNVTSLPPSRYDYTMCQERPDLNAGSGVIESANTPPVLFDNENVDFVDLNGDALPDLLRTISAGSGHRVYFNQGEREDAFGPYMQWSEADFVSGAGVAPASALMLEGADHLLADFDGDGAADFVQMSNSATYYFPNTPTSDGAGWGPRNSLLGALPPSPFGAAADVRTGDFNFDKRIDVIRSIGLNGYDVWFNLGSGEFSEPQRTNLRSYDLSAPNVKTADLNGDRLLDMARIYPTSVAFTVGLGHGQFDEEQSLPIPDYALTAGEVSKASLQDVNGDGIADLVVDRPVNGEVWYWPNRGNLSFGERVRIHGLPSAFSIDAAVRWLDLNGNGTTDMVVARNGQFAAVDLGRAAGCVPRPFLLNHIENGIGRTETISYTTSVEFALDDGTDATGAYTYPWTHPLPFPVTVIKEIQTADGMGNAYRTAFRYHDGYYDPEEKQFRGFARVEQIDIGDATAPTLESRFTFDVGDREESLKGKMLRQVVATEGGEVFTDTVTDWTIKDLHTGLDGRSVAFAHTDLQTVDILERGAGTPRRIETEFAYDNYGNEIERREYGVVESGNRSAFQDERSTHTEFALNTDLWMLRFPKRKELRKGDGSVFFRRDLFYDDESFSAGNFGQVNVGNLTLVREWPDPEQPGVFIEASRTRYDPYGNAIELLDPLYGLQPGHWRQIAYDPDFHALPVSETIHTAGTPASLVTQASYDYGFGVMVGASDFNTNSTSFGYDALSRLTSVVKPGDSSSFPTETHAYLLAQQIPGIGLLNWVATSKRETAGGGTFDSRTYMDGLGRTLQTRCEGENAGQFIVTGAATFNARRGKARSYLPYFAGRLDYAPPNPDVAAYSDLAYDATLRPTGTTNPPETEGGPRRASRTVYEPLVTRLFDEEDNTPGSPHEGTPHIQYQDGLGRLTGVDEMNRENDGAIGIYPTRYQYDVYDQLTRILDSQLNQKSMRYDGLKRMVFMHDPDRGIMTYTYDAASNLTRTVDAKGQEIIMAYDGANRIQSEDYLDAAGRTPDVTYSYDSAIVVAAGDGTSATSQQVKGMLSSVTDLSGGEVLSYDARGRTAWKIKRIPDPKTGLLANYQSVFAYDSLDRLTALTYPDGDHVGYTYNARNLPQSITGGPSGFIVPNMNYLASGQLDTTSYGNGVATHYSYDPRLRLRSLSTEHSALNTTLISFAYQFDAASNITRIDDNRAAIPASDPRKNTQVFGYDDLYRLTSVQYPALLAGSVGSISYAYDRIGNMLSQTSNIAATENGLPVTNLGTMSYGGTAGPSGRIGRSAGQPGPHALTAVSGGSRSYPYDANGNMETIDGMTCTWDFKDRLIAVENAQMRADYTYDYTDRRTTKKVTPKSITPLLPHSISTTVYVDRTYELRPSGEPTKYVWNGETRVARVTTNLNATQRLQRFSLQPGWNLCTLAVALKNADTQLSTGPVQNAYRYDPATQTYHSISAGESLPAGTLLRVRASTAGELALRGTPAAPVSVNYPAGRHWIGNATFQPLDLATALPTEAPLWFWQAVTQAWRHRLPRALSTASDAPVKLEPGEAIFALHTAAFTLAPADPTLEVRYYHQDHLGSSGVMTDTTGQLVNESTFYPFGHPRNEHEPRNVKEAYGFTQKERDGESGLSYFEARFLATTLARFTRVDSALEKPSASYLNAPQALNAYAYCSSKPIILHDPSGDVAVLAPLLTFYAIVSFAFHSNPANAPSPSDKVLPPKSNVEWVIDSGMLIFQVPVPPAGKIASLAEKKFIAPILQKLESGGTRAVGVMGKVKVVSKEGVLLGMNKATQNDLKGAVKKSSAVLQIAGKEVTEHVAGDMLTDAYKNISGMSPEAKAAFNTMPSDDSITGKTLTSIPRLVRHDSTSGPEIRPAADRNSN
jgi:RHS repeat-associated protein